jgi:hypothetical protein
MNFQFNILLRSITKFAKLQKAIYVLQIMIKVAMKKWFLHLCPKKHKVHAGDFIVIKFKGLDVYARKKI